MLETVQPLEEISPRLYKINRRNGLDKKQNPNFLSPKQTSSK